MTSDDHKTTFKLNVHNMYTLSALPTTKPEDWPSTKWNGKLSAFLGFNTQTDKTHYKLQAKNEAWRCGCMQDAFRFFMSALSSLLSSHPHTFPLYIELFYCGFYFYYAFVFVLSSHILLLTRCPNILLSQNSDFWWMSGDSYFFSVFSFSDSCS